MRWIRRPHACLLDMTSSRLLTQLARRVPRRGQRALATATSSTPSKSHSTETTTQRPSEYYSRPRDTTRDLPSSTSRTPLLLAVSALGLGAWGAFYAYATNAERLSNSVTLQVLDTARADPGLRTVLGDAIRPAPAWWLNGDPWIAGAINTLQGHVDLSFRLKGHKRMYSSSAHLMTPLNILQNRVHCTSRVCVSRKAKRFQSVGIFQFQ
jgi:cytochrome c oxidase assembly factor 1